MEGDLFERLTLLMHSHHLSQHAILRIILISNGLNRPVEYTSFSSEYGQSSVAFLIQIFEETPFNRPTVPSGGGSHAT